MNINLNNISRCRFVCMLLLLCVFYSSLSVACFAYKCCRCVVISYRIFEYTLSTSSVLLLLLLSSLLVTIHILECALDCDSHALQSH